MPAAVHPLVETWTIHNRINLYLLDAIAPASLAVVAPSKGRSVGAAVDKKVAFGLWEWGVR